MSEDLTLESIYQDMCVVTEVITDTKSIVQEAMFDVNTVIVSSIDSTHVPRLMFKGHVVQEASTDVKLVCTLMSTTGGTMTVEDTSNSGDLLIHVSAGDNDVITFKAIKRNYQVNDIDKELLIQKEEFVETSS